MNVSDLQIILNKALVSQVHLKNARDLSQGLVDLKIELMLINGHLQDIKKLCQTVINQEVC